MKIAVIGIGQCMRGDDGAGIEAVRQWRESFPKTATRSEIRVEVSELPGLALLDSLNEADAAILADAIQGTAKPGTIHCLSENMLSAFTTDSKSAHGWGLVETLQLGHELTKMNTNIRIIGIEAEQMEMGMGLSNSVREALPIACATIEEEIKKILG
jgi:hydrogenase maturation protease